jgi:hypothetical protein
MITGASRGTRRRSELALVPFREYIHLIRLREEVEEEVEEAEEEESAS